MPPVTVWPVPPATFPTTWPERIVREPPLSAIAPLPSAPWALWLLRRSTRSSVSVAPPGALSTETASSAPSRSVSALSVSGESSVTSMIRVTPPPLSAVAAAPWPVMVSDRLAIVSFDASVIVPVGSTIVVVSPAGAAAIAARSVPGPLSARLVTLTVAALAGDARTRKAGITSKRACCTRQA